MPQVTLPVPRLERHADTYNDAECATITIQVPTLNLSSRSASRSPDVSSIGSSYQGGISAVSEPPRQVIRRGSMVDSDASSAKDIIMHNGHILLMAKESDASYQSHGSASDSLQLSEDLAIHVPLFAKKSDASAGSDSLHLSDDFDDTADIEQNSQEIPLISKNGDTGSSVCIGNSDAGNSIRIGNVDETIRVESTPLTVNEEYLPLVPEAKSDEHVNVVHLKVLRQSETSANHGKSMLDIPKVHNFVADGPPL